MVNNHIDQSYSEMHRILEFYSGIGGMQYAFQLSNNSGDILAAFDINTVANSVYKHNLEKFKKKSIVQQKSIESLSISYYDSFNANVWLMSPPCQPYTRTGLHKGSSDLRAKSFLFLIDMLSKMSSPPTYILIENVKGFEESDTRNTLVTQLKNCNYNYQELFITPVQLGIPNSRLRYYMLAKKQPLILKGSDRSKIFYHIPCSSYNQPLSSDLIIRPIDDFLHDDVNYEKYSVPNETLIKYGKLFDIVKPSSRRSCCFTKGYYHYVEATGSIIQLSEDLDSDKVFNKVERKGSILEQENIDLIPRLKLRYFTENEIASIMGFPKEFSFPDEITLKQRYRVLGNSINVIVVSELIKYLLSD
ncbi:283_t:CDS:2 [Funneliformis caledonium]|uniref:tRNA (cytosine(38)-C(5))-methyltransferase n=1 Tax=Funneliformis caledonium TaxID=1117310 RepID=A0A9N8VX31_9GLOM|nr:283_t:CDS:2 [Funneliformis caledonium]